MAKKNANKAAARITVEAAALAATVPVINVPPGGTLEVIVDVGPMVFPYTIAYAEQTLIKSLVDRKEAVPVKPGTNVLAWAFAHGAKDWSHKVTYSINGGTAQLLEEKSEKKKDRDTSLGFAVVNA